MNYLRYPGLGQKALGLSSFSMLVHAIGKKIVEEASEVWMAAEHESDSALALEISQLLYHVQVLMIAKSIKLSDINSKL